MVDYFKRRAVILLGVLVLLVIGEIFLRMVFGFTDAVLFQEDAQIEYLAVPNQDRYRFGNRIRYNEFSMRSEPLKGDSRRILGMGDSILNGGALCDQEALATYLLEREFLIESGQNIQVLSISAPSWGPDNAMAYLEKFGDFNAEIIFLVTSSHDAYDNMNFTPVVGTSKNYPDKQYSLAYAEGLDRYFLPWLGRNLKGKKRVTGSFDSSKPDKIFNSGFQDIFSYTQNHEIPFFLYLHPELSEVKKGRYNKKGQLILEFAQENNIRVINGLAVSRAEYYLDNIHLNETGQQFLFEQLYPHLKGIMISGN